MRMVTILASIGLLLIFNSAIALLLTIVGFSAGFGVNMLYSQCIGGSVATTNWLLVNYVQPGRNRWLAIAVAIPLSVVVGIALGDTVLSRTQYGASPGNPYLFESLAIGMIFAVIGSTVFLLAHRLMAVDSALQQKQLETIESERREMVAQLKLLQAQIEPHFLFNTLANVSVLIDLEPEQAKKLLNRLIDWLRLALERSRKDRTILGEELELIENWLDILTIRYGSRLNYTIDVPIELHQCSLPPMVLQPLVENAVCHGIEPKVGGGTILIKARKKAELICLEVIDDGIGLANQDATQFGVGLENVRARLDALYGRSGSLRLDPGQATGVIATIEIPCEH
jgi:LytS/YehU family sensor histidine kinase